VHARVQSTANDARRVDNQDYQRQLTCSVTIGLSQLTCPSGEKDRYADLLSILEKPLAEEQGYADRVGRMGRREAVFVMMCAHT
jgi:hypothetical protein